MAGWLRTAGAIGTIFVLSPVHAERPDPAALAAGLGKAAASAAIEQGLAAGADKTEIARFARSLSAMDPETRALVLELARRQWAAAGTETARR